MSRVVFVPATGLLAATVAAVGIAVAEPRPVPGASDLVALSQEETARLTAPGPAALTNEEFEIRRILRAEPPSGHVYAVMRTPEGEPVVLRDGRVLPGCSDPLAKFRAACR